MTWVHVQDDTGRTYFWNTVTEETTWFPPRECLPLSQALQTVRDLDAIFRAHRLRICLNISRFASLRTAIERWRRWNARSAGLLFAAMTRALDAWFQMRTKRDALWAEMRGLRASHEQLIVELSHTKVRLATSEFQRLQTHSHRGALKER